MLTIERPTPHLLGVGRFIVADDELLRFKLIKSSLIGDNHTAGIITSPMGVLQSKTRKAPYVRHSK